MSATCGHMFSFCDAAALFPLEALAMKASR